MRTAAPAIRRRTLTGWAGEEALDVEWAHAIAPQANIILIEAASTSDADLISTAVNTARNLPGVSVISMSFGRSESSSDSSEESVFHDSHGSCGRHVLASTGDSGSPGGFPSFSPNVVAVGGTTLTISGTSYVSETGWSWNSSYGWGTGGGQSTYETEPSYQTGVQSSGWRQTPDVSFDADPLTGVAIYDSYEEGSSTPWVQIGGTSVSSPCWAGLIAIGDQLRASVGSPTMDGRTQTLPALYAMPAADFHDIISGNNNGHSAGPGYDMVTGIGSPVANMLVPAFVPATSQGTVAFSAHSCQIGTSVDDYRRRPGPGRQSVLPGDRDFQRRRQRDRVAGGPRRRRLSREHSYLGRRRGSGRRHPGDRRRRNDHGHLQRRQRRHGHIRPWSPTTATMYNPLLITTTSPLPPAIVEPAL